MSARTARHLCPTYGCAGGVRPQTHGLCLDCHREKKERDQMTRPGQSSAFSTRPPDLPDAACQGEDVDLFFPVTVNDTERIWKAKQVCRRCPAAAACLRHALEHEDAGTWGGASEWDRVLMRQRARAQGAS